MIARGTSNLAAVDKLVVVSNDRTPDVLHVVEAGPPSATGAGLHVLTGFGILFRLLLLSRVK